MNEALRIPQRDSVVCGGPDLDTINGKYFDVHASYRTERVRLEALLEWRPVALADVRVHHHDDPRCRDGVTRAFKRFHGGPARTRTWDQVIMSHLL
jgi:hypothetical protein